MSDLAAFIRGQIQKNMGLPKQMVGPGPGGLGNEGAAPAPGEDPNEAAEPQPEAMEPPGQPEPAPVPEGTPEAPNPLQSGMRAVGGAMGGLAKGALQGLGQAGSAALSGMNYMVGTPEGAEDRFSADMKGADMAQQYHQQNMAAHQAKLAEIQNMIDKGGTPTPQDMAQLQAMMHPGASQGPDDQSRQKLAQAMMQMGQAGGGMQ